MRTIACGPYFLHVPCVLSKCITRLRLLNKGESQCFSKGSCLLLSISCLLLLSSETTYTSLLCEFNCNDFRISASEFLGWTYNYLQLAVETTILTSDLMELAFKNQRVQVVHLAYGNRRWTSQWFFVNDSGPLIYLHDYGYQAVRCSGEVSLLDIRIVWFVSLHSNEKEENSCWYQEFLKLYHPYLFCDRLKQRRWSEGLIALVRIHMQVLIRSVVGHIFLFHFSTYYLRHWTESTSSNRVQPD